LRVAPVLATISAMSASEGRTAARRIPIVMAALAVVLALAGCARTTQGSGRAPSTLARTSGSSSPDFPSRSESRPPTTSPTGGAGGSSAPVPTTPSTSVPATPTRDRRDAQLTTQTNSEAHVLVPIPRGYEAATYDRTGGIQFWRVVGTEPGWRQVGVSSYPAEVDGKPYDVSVTGALLHGMKNATFIVRGQFTTDNSGLAVAYTTGPKGWGAIKAESNGNIGPSGKPVGSDRIGLSRGFAFVGGDLQTEDCPQNLPIASCGGHEVVKLWRWSGKDFTRAS
jgi:hypothetical protein